MALLRHQNVYYQMGFVLFFIAFTLFACSLVIPGTWIYEKNKDEPSSVRGRSVWFLRFSVCLPEHSQTNSSLPEHSQTNSSLPEHSQTNSSLPWRCDTLGVDYAHGEKLGGVVLMVLGTMTQLLACVLVIVDNCQGQPGCPAVEPFVPEVVAGTAVTLSYAGLLLYIRFTYIAVNITLGPGIFMHSGACLLAYVGLLLTAVNQI